MGTHLDAPCEIGTLGVALLCFPFAGNHVDMLVVSETDLPVSSLEAGAEFASDGGVVTAAKILNAGASR